MLSTRIVGAAAAGPALPCPAPASLPPTTSPALASLALLRENAVGPMQLKLKRTCGLGLALPAQCNPNLSPRPPGSRALPPLLSSLSPSRSSRGTPVSLCASPRFSATSPPLSPSWPKGWAHRAGLWPLGRAAPRLPGHHWAARVGWWWWHSRPTPAP